MARPDGVCRTCGSGFEVGSVVPAGGIEIGIAGMFGLCEVGGRGGRSNEVELLATDRSSAWHRPSMVVDVNA